VCKSDTVFGLICILLYLCE